MGNDDKEMMAEVVFSARRSIEQHARTLELIRHLSAVAECGVSTEDVARHLLKALGSEREVKAWVEAMSRDINRALTIWYMTARIEAHETKGNQA